MAVFSRRIHMPPLTGATEWLNSEPLRPGRAARARRPRRLLDADVHQVAADAAVRPCVVAGLPERRAGSHRSAHARSSRSSTRWIDYPVAVDNGYEIWSAFANHYWPALYFVDADGIIRDHHFGEGRYERSERVIQRLLGVDRELLTVEGDRGRGGGRLGTTADARNVSRLRAQRALRVTRRRRVRRTSRLRAPGAPALQPLGARRRVDDRA